MISDALHGGDDHGDAGCLRGGANEACGMEHAFRTEERTAAKLEGDDVPGCLGTRRRNARRWRTPRGLLPLLILPTFSRLMSALLVCCSVLPLERLWRGLKRKKPAARSLPAVGWKLFASLLAVSPHAGSGNSLLSRSRGNRHGRLGGNSLGVKEIILGRKNSTRGDGCEGKVWKMEGKAPRGALPDHLQFFPSP